MEVDDVEELVDEFVASGVLEHTGDRGLRVTGTFGEHRDEYREQAASLTDAEFEARVEEYAGGGAAEVADVDQQTLGDAMAIFHATEDVSRQQCLTGALALQTLEATTAEQLPDGFLALGGDDIERFIQQSPAAIVYFWREDCGPCSAVEEHFEELLDADAVPEHVALGAVYGPDAVDLIREQYDVTVAPTVLFCSDGTVESRIVGNKGQESLEREIKRFG